MKKILSYRKKKYNNIYEITLSNNEKLELYDDVILKYELLLKKEIPEDLFDEIIVFNSYLESYNKALKYINTKLRTEKEIIDKLFGYSEDAINYTITRLRKEGYLDKDLYIKAYVNDAINLKLVGPLTIIHDLKLKGFLESDVEEYLATFDKEIWLKKIEKVMQKKVNSNHHQSIILLKDRVVEDLMHRGFYKNDILNVLDNFDFGADDNAIYEKEYNKLKTKLARKYSGKELEYRIKIGLIKKGFRKEY